MIAGPNLFTIANYGPMTEIQMQPDEILEVMRSIKEMDQSGLMVEWGSGGSTVKWLETMQSNQKLISIEHNQNWFNTVNDYVSSRTDIKDRFKYYYKPQLYGFDHGYASVIEEHPHGLDDYFIPDPKILDADIFFIDGVGRAACALFMAAFAKKSNPVVYLHDYYGRENWYSWLTRYFRHERVGSTLVRIYF